MATYEVTTDGGTYEVETQEQPSKLESFGRGVENNFPLANQAIAADSAIFGDKSYSKNLEEQNKSISNAKSANPISYDAGAVTGAIAPALIPGVGEAMSAAPKMAGAALGAANSIGNTDVVQNPTEALKQAAIGAGTGAALGAILPTGKGAAEEVENFANRKTVQGLGLKPGMLGIPKEDLEDLGQFAHEAGLADGPLEQRVNTAKELLNQAGAQVGNAGAGSTPLSDASSFIDQLHNKLQESASIFGPEANAETPVYRQALANLSKPGLTFDELQQLKTAVGQRAFDSTGNVKNDAAADVYGLYKDAMKSIIEGSPSEYQESMNAYGKLKDIHSALNSQFQKEQAGGLQSKGFGMVGKLAGMISDGNPAVNMGAAAALAPAHPFMALGALTPLMTNPDATAGAARSVAGAIPGMMSGLKVGSIDSVTSYLMKTLSSAPQKLGQFAQPLINAAKTGGSQGVAAQHYILSSKYPQYNEMMMKKEEEPTNA